MKVPALAAVAAGSGNIFSGTADAFRDFCCLGLAPRGKLLALWQMKN